MTETVRDAVRKVARKGLKGRGNSATLSERLIHPDLRPRQRQLLIELAKLQQATGKEYHDCAEIEEMCNGKLDMPIDRVGVASLAAKLRRYGHVHSKKVYVSAANGKRASNRLQHKFLIQPLSEPQSNFRESPWKGRGARGKPKARATPPQTTSQREGQGYTSLYQEIGARLATADTLYWQLGEELSRIQLAIQSLDEREQALEKLRGIL